MFNDMVFVTIPLFDVDMRQLVTRMTCLSILHEYQHEHCAILSDWINIMCFRPSLALKDSTALIRTGNKTQHVILMQLDPPVTSLQQLLDTLLSLRHEFDGMSNFDTFYLYTANQTRLAAFAVTRVS